MTSTALVLPDAAANHIVVADAEQVAAHPDGRVTLLFTLSSLGDPDGGIWAWSTGDGAAGSFEDGFRDGRYHGDASGRGVLSDGRPFEWSRRGAQSPSVWGTDAEPAHASYLVTYAYPRSGAYVVTWRNCCRESDAMLLVAAVNGNDPTAMPHAPIFWFDACQRLDEATIDCMQKWMIRERTLPEGS